MLVSLVNITALSFQMTTRADTLHEAWLQESYNVLIEPLHYSTRGEAQAAPSGSFEIVRLQSDGTNPGTRIAICGCQSKLWFSDRFDSVGKLI
jgi:hypothetical protein